MRKLAILSVVVGLLVAGVIWIISQLSFATQRSHSANTVRQLHLAMDNHQDAYRHLPLHAVYSKDGTTPLLSWRVWLIPFIESRMVASAFKFDEPWDSEHNRPQHGRDRQNSDCNSLPLVRCWRQLLTRAIFPAGAESWDLPSGR